MLTCKAAADVSKVYWYIDDKFFKAAHSGEKQFFVPTEGPVRIPVRMIRKKQEYQDHCEVCEFIELYLPESCHKKSRISEDCKLFSTRILILLIHRAAPEVFTTTVVALPL
jgi:hypothetical protein